MGKSEGNGIFLTEEPNSVKKKVMRAVTDSGPTIMNQEMPEAIVNLFTIMNVVSEKSVYDHYRDAYANCTIRYGDFKKQLAEDINKVISPIRERYYDYYNNNEYLGKIVQMGAEKARTSASETLKEVRSIIGFKSF